LGANSRLSRVTRISLANHIEDVANTLFYEDLSDVVLVGHSYADIIITGVAAKEPKRLAHLVYFDAYLPRDGENERGFCHADQLAKYRADIAADIRFREPLTPSFLGIDDLKMAE
jgi:pimeloyl-ACP methyl ester carboxylesterase